MKNTLSRYDTSISQVHSVATDNGANMLESVRRLGEPEDEDEGSSSDRDTDRGDVAFKAYGSVSVLDNQEDAQHLGADADFLFGVRCTTHTCQLAVSDALRELCSAPSSHNVTHL